ncbi:MAG: hypothetical protein Q7R53_02500 [bacterium]|nr:hypothetical protein [bacterium]
MDRPPSQNETPRVHERETKNILSLVYWQHAVKDMASDLSLAEAKEKLRAILVDLESGLGEKAIGFSLIVKDLEPLDSLDKFIQIASERMYEFLSTHFTLSELEGKERAGLMEHKNNRAVNELLYYTLFPGKKELILNIHNAVSLSTRDKLILFKNGLKEIAKRMQTDPELAQIETIKGRSWIIEDYPKLVNKMGFITDENDTAYLTKKVLLEKYGN